MDIGLHYKVSGEGPPVILIHGFAASNIDWIYLEPELVKRGYQVYAPDLIGHGNSQLPNPRIGLTFDDIYQHFSDWEEYLAIDSGVTLIGHSLGGLIALYYAITNPHSVKNLILINPYYTKKQLNRFLRYISRNPEPYRKALQITPAWLIHKLISLDLRGYIHYEDRTRKQKAVDVSRAAPDIVYIPRSIPEVSNHLKEVKISCCVIWGTKDTTLNPKSFPELVNSLPEATSNPINGAGHQPHLSRWEELNLIIAEYLSGQIT